MKAEMANQGIEKPFLEGFFEMEANYASSPKHFTVAILNKQKKQQ